MMEQWKKTEICTELYVTGVQTFVQKMPMFHVSFLLHIMHISLNVNEMKKMS